MSTLSIVAQPVYTSLQKIPIGMSDFATLIRENYLFIDKSLLIKALLDEPSHVVLITRPRRWGKTLNLSMLYYFLADVVDGRETRGLFDGLAIAQVANGRYLQEQQGRAPVIFLSFKDIKERTFAVAERKFYLQISQLYNDHDYLLQSNRLTAQEKILVNYFIQWFGRAYGVADELSLNEEKAHFTESLKLLTKILYKHHGVKAYILIDEYDTPLNSAYEHGYLEELSDFMRNLLSAGLKDNAALQKGILTGILRVSKNSMLSGLNNLKCFNLLHEKFSEYFGFTSAEVERVFASQGLATGLEQVKAWYNGYQFGSQTLYNPWSILNCASENKRLKPYWVWTGGEGLMRKMLLEGSNDIKAKFQALIREGGAITAEVTENVTYAELWQEERLWSLLLFAGYLTVVQGEVKDDTSTCVLAIPNQEVAMLYRAIFKNWLKEKCGLPRYQALLHSLLMGEVVAFAQTLNDYLLQAMSAHDFYREAEYHTFLLGLISAASDSHYVFSNKEYGLGRPDCVLIPKDSSNLKAIVLEFKAALLAQAGKGKKCNNLMLLQRQAKQLAAQALAQITLRGYSSALGQYPHIREVLQVGVGFCRRSVAVVSQDYCCQT